MERKLAAILAADVVGYSRLMGADEAGTHAALKALRAEVVDPRIAEHHGRIVKLIGDGALVEFASVVDALTCAVAIQRGMSERDRDTPAEKRIALRIGINLGDIIVDGDDIYGNGVNVAARLEALAEPGGICLSGRVLDQVKGNVDVGFASLGPQTVKNIEDPVNAYKVLFDTADAGRIVGAPKPKEPGRPWLIAAVVALVVVASGAGLWYHQTRPDFAPAAVAKMAYPLPDKPSIAVLPFENFSGDERDDFIAMGLTEDIITALSSIPELFVISRTSSFAFKDKSATVSEIAEALGVRYIVEGSIQRSGDTLRINAQLVDAVKGDHLWAENFDGKTEDLFALQDDIVRQITIELQVKLTFGDTVRVHARGTTNLHAWLLEIQANTQAFKFTREGAARSRELYQQAHEADPNWARPLAGIAWCYFTEAMQGWTDDREGWIRKGIEFAEKAIEMDPKQPLGYQQLGNIMQLQGDHDRAIAFREKAVELAPNDMGANWGLGVALYKAGQAERGLEYLKRAERLAPRHPVPLFWSIQEAQFLAGQYEQSIEAGKRAIARNAEPTFPHVLLVAAYGALGRTEESQAEAATILKSDPSFTVTKFMRTRSYKNQSDLDRLSGSLIKAGLPEKVTHALPEKPSIAVLPFTNIGGDPEQEYFADGMTDDLITDLSKVSGLHVIASNSVFTYKGKPVKVQDVAADLGVRYVLEGSVRRAGGRMRINAQLVDAAGGGHLWAERYDRQAEDVFAVQDEVTRAIVSALSVRLTETDRAELERPRGTRNLEAYDALLRGRERLGRVSRKNVEQGKALFEKAIALDPNYARAYTNLGFLYWHEWRLWGLDRDRNLAKAMELGRKAVELDDRAAGAHLLVALVHQYRGEHDQAEAEGRKVLALDPTQAETLGNLGRFLKASGRSEEAIAVLEKAMRIDPHHPPDWIGWLGQAHFRLGRYDEAIRILEAGVAEHPDLLPLHLYLADSYAMSGQPEKAKAQVAQVLRLNPDFTVGAYTAYNGPIEVTGNIEIDVRAMREAGFPE